MMPADVEMRFAEAVAGGMDLYDAAVHAGQVVQNRYDILVWARETMGKPEVRRRLEAIRAGLEAAEVSSAVASIAERRRILTSIARGQAIQEVRIFTSGPTGETTTTQERMPSAAERLAAIRHLDELDGQLAPRDDGAGALKAAATILSAIPDETLRARIAALTTKGQK